MKGMRQKSITDFVVYELLKISIKTVINLFDDEECLLRMCKKNRLLLDIYAGAIYVEDVYL